MHHCVDPMHAVRIVVVDELVIGVIGEIAEDIEGVVIVVEAAAAAVERANVARIASISNQKENRASGKRGVECRLVEHTADQSVWHARPVRRLWCEPGECKAVARAGVRRCR